MHFRMLLFANKGCVIFAEHCGSGDKKRTLVLKIEKCKQSLKYGFVTYLNLWFVIQHTPNLFLNQVLISNRDRPTNKEWCKL